VFDSLARQLDLRPIPGRRVIIHGVVNSEPAPLVDIETINVGDSTWVNPRVAHISGDHAGRGLDGILGVDFLRQYAVGFSRADRVVRLYPPELISERSYRGWNNIPLETDSVRQSKAVLYVMQLTIRNRRVKAVLDLGAGVNIMNWQAAEKLGVAKIKPSKGLIVSGANDSTPVTARVRAESMSTGSIKWRAEEFSVADLDIFSVLDLADEPAVILGAGLFTQRDFVIDFLRNRMLVSNNVDAR
ncbi:MAG: pepsin/retropepsin-like aspartic protease family protein, partial [Pseudomonadota bacterium]